MECLTAPYNHYSQYSVMTQGETEGLEVPCAIDGCDYMVHRYVLFICHGCNYIVPLCFSHYSDRYIEIQCNHHRRIEGDIKRYVELDLWGNGTVLYEARLVHMPFCTTEYGIRNEYRFKFDAEVVGRGQVE